MAFSFQNPNPDSEFTGTSFISIEELKIFHSIDRQLYTRLVISLVRDPAESIQVMALFFWLERVTSNLHLISHLLKLPDDVLYPVVEEAATVLNVIENDDLPYIDEDVTSSEIPLLQNLMSKSNYVTLRFFHNHRLGVIRGVTHLMNEICVKIFNDIMQKVVETRQFSLFQVSPNSCDMLGNVPRVNNIPRVRVFGVGSGTSGSGVPISYDGSINPRVYMEATTSPQPPYDDLQDQRDIMNAQMGELLDEVYMACIGDVGQKANGGSDVPPDDRTIFLTFSKGYPISESEVREFFTRRNGDVIDGIYMQEASLDEQILYARMVVKSQALVEVILGGKDMKAKFAINGKHVWGRKYVKKQVGAVTGTSSVGSPSGGK